MKARIIGPILVALVIAPFVACRTDNPARPSMSFTAPLAQGPTSGAAYNFTEQPISLTITNAVRTGSSPVTYDVEVATDAAFAHVVFSKAGVVEGSNGTTTVQLAALDGNTTYYWHWRAVVGGVSGEFSTVQSFFVRPNVVLSIPDVVQPSTGSNVFASRPTFTVQDVTRTGPAGTLFYEFQVSASDTFATLITSGTIQEQPAQTSWTPSTDLPEGTFYWRVRATDPGNGILGPFSGPARFQRKAGIDLSKVVYVQGPDISSWPQTVKITSASHVGDQLCISKEGEQWPSTDYFGDPTVQVEGNQWMFVNINGTWYGGAGHWYRPGQECKGEVDENFFIDAFRNPPFNSLVLHSGDVFAVALTTPARLWPDMRTLDHRSDILFVVW
jgi:hypothetical protein